VFTLPRAGVKQQLLTLRGRVQQAPSVDEAGQLLDDWLAQHMTPEGRKRILGALRRKRSDQAKRGARRRSMTLSTETMERLEALAKGMGGIPLTQLLSSFISIANTDEDLRKQLVFLAMSTGVKPSKKN